MNAPILSDIQLLPMEDKLQTPMLGDCNFSHGRAAQAEGRVNGDVKPEQMKSAAVSPLPSASTAAKVNQKPMAFKPTPNAASVRHGQKIRYRYFSRLGISPTLTHDSRRVTTQQSNKNRSQDSTQDSNKIDIQRYDSLCSNTTATTSSCSSFDACSIASVSSVGVVATSAATSTKQNKKKVTFSQDPPSVQLIPSRHDYSAYRKDCIWISPREMQTSYCRNVVEYQSEHWDYRRCIEEDQFVRMANGDLIHPIHISLMLLEQQQQMQQQQQAHYYPYASPSDYDHHHQYDDCVSGSPPSHNRKNVNHFCRVMSAQQRS